MNTPNERLDKNILGNFLSPKNRDCIERIIIIDELPSTNDYLLALAKQSPSETVRICLAEKQTAGKGRLGRRWVSPFACNIYGSILWYFSKTLSELCSLSLAVNVAIIETLKQMGIDKGLSLKWPNDVLWNHRKLAGVLTETAGGNHGRLAVIVGIGINVNMPKDAAASIDQPWVDMATITQSIPSRNQVAGLLLDQLLSTLTLFEQKGLRPFLNAWKAHDASFNKPVSLSTPHAALSGVGKGVDEKGRFLLQDPSGKIHAFPSGEVSLRHM